MGDVYKLGALTVGDLSHDQNSSKNAFEEDPVNAVCNPLERILDHASFARILKLLIHVACKCICIYIYICVFVINMYISCTCTNIQYIHLHILVYMCVCLYIYICIHISLSLALSLSLHVQGLPMDLRAEIACKLVPTPQRAGADPDNTQNGWNDFAYDAVVQALKN